MKKIVCMLTIFTIGFTIVLSILDFISLCISSMYAVTCYKKLKDNNIISIQEFIIYSLLSFIYCIDVIIAIKA